VICDVIPDPTAFGLIGDPFRLPNEVGTLSRSNQN
jgi:hypothetical protein